MAESEPNSEEETIELVIHTPAVTNLKICGRSGPHAHPG